MALCLALMGSPAAAQKRKKGKKIQASFTTYWQQAAKYKMEVDLNTKNHRFTGTQELYYTNNSPDTLRQVFYHLYFNAFRPGSMMDVRSRSIEDPDGRVTDRISKLKPEEYGELKAKSLKMNGKDVKMEHVGTILEVELPQPILPGQSATFAMEFEGQVPLQIRRSGRDNAEGIDYTMTQWYPKMSEYDVEGWHANPYVGREFHGIWGDFDVKLTLDSSYVVGGSGLLQNPQEIGHGYEKPGSKVNRPAGDKLTWHFIAENVHDFAWAADPDFTHDVRKVKDGPELHFLYQEGTGTKAWADMQPYAEKLFPMMAERFGKYPYPQYSIIQGGDGGMEYAMCTMITGERSFGSLVSVVVHEAVHSWYQMLLGTNEAKYPWMDEGFTTFAQDFILDLMFEQKKLNPQKGNYQSYYSIAQSERAEPMTTHADHYQTNRAYGINAYSKGAVFLKQLSYVVGNEAFWQGMYRYFEEWKFKHPTPRDFKRVMEKTSGLELDWYFEHFVGTLNTTEYGVVGLEISDQNKTDVILRRNNAMPMPLDIFVQYKDDTYALYHIPLRIMRGAKKEEKGLYEGVKYHVAPDWPWVYPEYRLQLDRPASEVARIIIDPSQRLADVNSKNDVYPQGGGLRFEGE